MSLGLDAENQITFFNIILDLLNDNKVDEAKGIIKTHIQRLRSKTVFKELQEVKVEKETKKKETEIKELKEEVLKEIIQKKEKKDKPKKERKDEIKTSKESSEKNKEKKDDLKSPKKKDELKKEELKSPKKEELKSPKDDKSKERKEGLKKGTHEKLPREKKDDTKNQKEKKEELKSPLKEELKSPKDDKSKEPKDLTEKVSNEKPEEHKRERRQTSGKDLERQHSRKGSVSFRESNQNKPDGSVSDSKEINKESLKNKKTKKDKKDKEGLLREPSEKQLNKEKQLPKESEKPPTKTKTPREKKEENNNITESENIVEVPIVDGSDKPEESEKLPIISTEKQPKSKRWESKTSKEKKDDLDSITSSTETVNEKPTEDLKDSIKEEEINENKEVKLKKELTRTKGNRRLDSEIITIDPEEIKDLKLEVFKELIQAKNERNEKTKKENEVKEKKLEVFKELLQKKNNDIDNEKIAEIKSAREKVLEEIGRTRKYTIDSSDIKFAFENKNQSTKSKSITEFSDLKNDIINVSKTLSDQKLDKKEKKTLKSSRGFRSEIKHSKSSLDYPLKVSQSSERLSDGADKEDKEIKFKVESKDSKEKNKEKEIKPNEEKTENSDDKSNNDEEKKNEGESESIKTTNKKRIHLKTSKSITNLSRKLSQPLKINQHNEAPPSFSITVNKTSTPPIAYKSITMSGNINNPNIVSAKLAENNNGDESTACSVVYNFIRNEKQAKAYNYVVKEFIETEKTYVRDLKIIVEVFKIPMEEKELITQSESPIIFSNVEMLLQVNEELLNRLLLIENNSNPNNDYDETKSNEKEEECKVFLYKGKPNEEMIKLTVNGKHKVREVIKLAREKFINDEIERNKINNVKGVESPRSKYANWCIVNTQTQKPFDPDLNFFYSVNYQEGSAIEIDFVPNAASSASSIGECLLQMANYLKAYTQYCSMQMKQISLLKTLEEEREGFKKFLNATMRNKRCRHLDLSSFLIMPLQRVCKYPLLLRELIAATPSEHKDYKSLQSANKIICDTVLKINNRSKEIEQMNFISTLQNSIDGKNLALVKPGRSFVGQGKLNYFPNKKSLPDKFHSSLYFLFNDLFVITTPMGDDDRYKLIAQLDLNDCIVNDFNLHPHSFEIAKSGKTVAIIALKNDKEKQKVSLLVKKAIMKKTYADWCRAAPHSGAVLPFDDWFEIYGSLLVGGK